MSETPQTPDNKVSFKHTLNLPTTDFPIRSNAKVDDPAMLERWEKEDLFHKTFTHNHGNKKFVLHDGPPYANGHLHLGHAYNKILKDIVTKSKRMLGQHVPVTPGWDCHGLPIEFKVSQENPGLSAQELKRKCREYAQHWIDVQRKEFKHLGVLMDWHNPYITMSYGYEADTIRAFGDFVEQGYIERKNKTVPWCGTCKTVLAAAEIEYQERKDPSIYVLFPLDTKSARRIMPNYENTTLNLLVWTTTPWTLPLNRAVLVRLDTTYAIVDFQGIYVVVAKQLVDKISQTIGMLGDIKAEFNSTELLDAQAHHPFVANLVVPVLQDQSVSLEDGTACVHSAPGCGPEDYEVGVRNNLEIFSPLTPDGKYDVGIQPQELQGMPITDGQIWVLKKLTETNTLLFKTSIRHPYPHCWRCRNGLMFRATKQWFCDLSRHNLKQRVLDAIQNIKTLPKSSANRLTATVEGRLEWCLSRQRVWGIPIPALLCTTCDYYYVTQEFVQKVAAQVATQGIEYWDEVTLEQLDVNHISCPSCKTNSFKKEKDILDVWFDSGISHFAVLQKNPALAFPADMYLEGKDQHRGWFQSSLLTSMVMNNQACMKTIITHGFTVDDKGRKMSKSLGNVVAPQEMIDKLGTDGLRLWASSVDCEGDATVSDILLQNVQEVYRKIRNTCRFLLSNLYDYDHEHDAIPLGKLTLLDQYALEQLFRLNHTVLNYYNGYEFTAVFHALADYCSVELSAFYLDIIKDRLYTHEAHGHARRSAQTACWHILDTLTRLMAPILSFTAEQLSDHYQKNKQESIHLQQFSNLHGVWEMLGDYYAQSRKILYPNLYASPSLEPLMAIEGKLFVSEQDIYWALLKEVRGALLKALEVQREQGNIKHSLEARITMFLDTKHDQLGRLNNFFKMLARSGQTREEFFKELVIVSQIELVDTPIGLEESSLHGLWVKVEHAHGDKCPRCWQWEVTSNVHKLCSRCSKIVG